VLVDVAFSLVIPAFDEALRLPPFLESVRQHLDHRYPDNHEIIVVDDGSRDALPEVLAAQQDGWPELTVRRHAVNRGKGAAVRTGVLAARGDVILFADADGATPIDQEVALCKALGEGADVAVGSRLLAADGVQRRRSRLRGSLGRLFARLARRWLRISVCDTQCGFKMFRREAARRLFSLAQETGYLFDLELLMAAGRLGYRVAEVPVCWREVAGGHLSIAREIWRVPLGLWRIRRRTSKLARVGGMQ